MRPPKLSAAQRAFIRGVAAARDAIPSNKTMALQMRVTESTIEHYVTLFRRLSIVSCETINADNRAPAEQQKA
jgi:hypothetical protein